MIPSPDRIQAVIFDYGEVISQPMRQDTVVTMADVLGLPKETLLKLYWQFRDDYDLGRLDGKTYWHKVAAAAAVPCSDDQLARMMNADIDTWKAVRPEIIELVRQLKERGYKTGILSNMHHEFLAYLRRECEWMNLFDSLIFSCEYGIMKPELEIYQLAIKQLGTEPSKTIFVDDRQVNVDGALKAGLKAMIFTNPEDLKLALA